MLIRIWKTGIKPDRLDELKDFANTYSLPMFRKQTGCLGVLFTLDGNVCATISIWEDMSAIEKLKSSASYNETVKKIAATGMLEGEQSVEVFDCFGGYLDFDTVSEILQPSQ